MNLLRVLQVDLNVGASATGRQETVVLQPRSKDLQEQLEEQQEQLEEQQELLGQLGSSCQTKLTSLPHSSSSSSSLSAAGAPVQQDSKLVQVDLQDLGYETCGRSENEAEREDTSSPGSDRSHVHTLAPSLCAVPLTPGGSRTHSHLERAGVTTDLDVRSPAEFDDLEMCTSLDCASQWWPSTSTEATSQNGDSSLRRLVQDLRSQLSGSQALVRDLRAQLGSLSSSRDPSSLRKVNWCLEAASQSGAEEDEGWQSSSDGPRASPRQPCSDRDLRDLASRVDALEDQLREGGKKPRGEDRKCPAWPG